MLIFKILVLLAVVLQGAPEALAQGADEGTGERIREALSQGDRGALVVPNNLPDELMDCLRSHAQGEFILAGDVIACSESSGVSLGLLIGGGMNLATQNEEGSGPRPDKPMSPIPPGHPRDLPAMANKSKNVEENGTGPDKPMSPVPPGHPRYLPVMANKAKNVEENGTAPDKPMSPIPNGYGRVIAHNFIPLDLDWESDDASLLNNPDVHAMESGTPLVVSAASTLHPEDVLVLIPVGSSGMTFDSKTAVLSGAASAVAVVAWNLLKRTLIVPRIILMGIT